MPCPFCTSINQVEYPAEVNIHFPGRRNADIAGVFVYPKLLVCLDCGSSLFTTPASELRRLAGVERAAKASRCDPMTGPGAIADAN
jgi:hypothetical protein